MPPARHPPAFARPSPRRLSPLIGAALIAVLPLAALADKPAHAGKGGHGASKAQTVAPKARTGKRIAQANGCPPGLAKKDPACLPPGQARKGVAVGRVVDRSEVHLISRPGLYGLAEAPAGSRYAIVDGRLVRISKDSYKILSVLRAVDAILD